MYDDRTAEIYDLLYRSTQGRAPRDGRVEAQRVLAEISAERPGSRTLLDVGCGTGRHLPHLGDALELHGLDINRRFLERAREARPDAILHEADMERFEIGIRFDVITCLFSAIAWVGTLARLRATLERFARHLAPGGVIILEPWFTPESYWEGHVAFNVAEHDGFRVAWAYRQEREDRLSVLEVKYLVATADGVDHYTERHELGLFTDDEYRAAMRDVGLEVRHDPLGFGRGLYIAVAPE